MRNLHLCQFQQYCDSVMTEAERKLLSGKVYRLITAYSFLAPSRDCHARLTSSRDAVTVYNSRHGS